MLETISIDEVDLDGSALAVRCSAIPDRPGVLLVTIMVHRTEGDAGFMQRSELALVTVREPVPREALRSRVEAEAARRGIARVAWVEEDS
jgi:hypothetical protein